LTFWKNKNVYAKVTRNCRWPETVEFTVVVGNTSCKCSVSFILNNCITVWLYLSWTGWQCVTMVIENNVVSILFVISLYNLDILVGNKLYFTNILTFIPVGGKSKSFKHSLIIYWTALVHTNKTRRTEEFCRCNNLNHV